MALETWAPSVAAVGAVLRARTVDRNGTELGTFTPTTRPTDAQVLTLMDDIAEDEVVGALPRAVTAVYETAARSLVALRTAMQIELTYFAEQLGTSRSIYPQLKELYDDALKRLTTRMDRDTKTEAAVEGAPLFSGPSGGFDDVPIIGWKTLW